MVDNNGYMDIDGKLPRGRSNCLSNIFFRDLPAHSSVSSIQYMERMEIQNNDLSWAVNEGGLVSLPTLSKSPNMPLSHAEGASNSNISTYSLNGISPNSIPYLINQSTEPNL